MAAKRNRILAAFLALIMTAASFQAVPVRADEIVADRFVVLDEQGNPVVVETTVQDLQDASLEGKEYTVVAYTEEEQTVLGEFTEIEEAGASYEETVEFLQTASTYSAEESSAQVQIVDESGNVVSTTEDVIGIVRFNRDSTTFYFNGVETGRQSYLSPYMTADAAYIRTESDGIVCKVSGVVMKVALEDVAAIESYVDNTVSRYYLSDGYLVHRYGYYEGSTLTTASCLVGYAPSYLTSGKNYYSYDGHYFYDSFETMIADYRNDTYENAVNAGNPFYNYYQYLSLRSTAVFTGEEYSAYITSKKPSSVMADEGDSFVNAQNTYTINSLLMLGVAINESGWGTSKLALEKNNLFGLNAVDDSAYESADTFPTVQDCIENFAYGWMQCKYLSGANFRYNGAHLGDKQSGINVLYASDPYWGEKAAARGYYYDTEKADYGRYTIGIATEGIISLYKEADTQSKVIYTSECGSGGDLYDYPLILIGLTEGEDGVMFYKVVSDMALLEDRSGRDVEAIFDSSRDYVYVPAEQIQVVFDGSERNFELYEPEKTQEEVIAHLGVTNTDGYLTGLTLGADVSALLQEIAALSEDIVTVAKDKNGSQITSGTLATGMTLSVTTNGTTEEYILVVRGDVSGDGKISALDYVKIRNNLDKVTTLSGAYLKSADASGDGKVSALDYVKVRNHLDKKSTITQ